MPNLTYTENLPNPPNLPSQDVNAMNQNTNSVNRIFVSATNPTLDNIGFNNGDGGFHRQVSMKNQVAPGLQAQDGVLFANQNVANSWPFWQNGLGVFQLAGSASSNNPSAAINGWSFLPGGLIMQWGIIDGASTPAYTLNAFTPVLFATANINFPANCFNVQVTPIPFVFGTLGPTTVSVGAFSTTSFSFYATNATSGAYIGFYWTAIGN